MEQLRKASLVGKVSMWLGITLACLLFSSPLSAQEPKLRWTLRGHTGEVRCVAFSPDGTTLASGGSDNTIRFWDVTSSKEKATLKNAPQNCPLTGVDSLAFRPDGKTLATGSGSKYVTLWDVATRKDTTLLDAGKSQGPRSFVVLSADGKALASGDEGIRLWDVSIGKELATLKGHTELVWSVVFSPDGKTLVAGGDKTIKLWDVKTGKELATQRTQGAGAVRDVSQRRQDAGLRERRQDNQALGRGGGEIDCRGVAERPSS